jgi:hypothetical protein
VLILTSSRPVMSRHSASTEQRYGNRSGLNDYVTNEAVGIPLMICEDWLDKHVARPLEGRRTPIDAIRLLTSPTRSFANLMAFHRPWFRENRD